MPKKPPPNPFFFYMKELQEQMKSRGQRVPSLREMPALASPNWNRMSPGEKAKYEDMAREFKRNRTNTDDGRFTSDGIPIQILKQQEAEAEDKIKAIDAAVRSMITTFHSVDEISQSSFFIMGFNILVGTLEELFLPNEIGIVEYSISEGIRKEYHMFIDPGPIPIGYTSTAKLNSETVHEIPINGFELATSNYSKLYKDVKQFLGVHTHAEPRYIYCHPEQMHQFQCCLDWLKINSRLDGREEIIFANLAVLVSELKITVNEAYPYKSSSVDAITSNAFDYSPNTLCNFHDEKDNKNCALGYCKRLSYVLSDILCNPFGVELTPKHLPERPSTSVESSVWEPKQELRPVFNIVDVPIKPVVPRVTTTILKHIRSKFDDDDDYSITPSAMSDASSVVSDSIDLQLDDSMFPSLSDRMGAVSLSSASVPTGTPLAGSWAKASSKREPLRMPRSDPESMRHIYQASSAGSTNSAPSIAKAAGIGRGRGLVYNK